MKVTSKLTTDLIVFYINIPTDEGMEHYMVEVDRPDMDEDIYCISIYDTSNLISYGDLYSTFDIDSDYGILGDYKLGEREELILDFIYNRLRLD